MSIQQPSSNSRQGLPAYIVVLVLLLAVAGAAVLVWYLVLRESAIPDSVAVDLGPGNPRIAPARRDQPRRDSAPVRVQNDSSIWAGVGNLHLIFPTKPGAQLDFHNHASEGWAWATPPQRELLTAAFRIVRAAARGRPIIDVSDEQLTKLKALTLETRLILTDPDRSRLSELVAAWQKAPAADAKSAAEKALLAAVKEIGDKAEVAARQTLAQTAALVAQILTPQQLQQYRALQPATRPQTRPATRPLSSTRPA